MINILKKARDILSSIGEGVETKLDFIDDIFPDPPPSAL